MRDLLTESGSIFVQISDENLHRIQSVMDEVFGNVNFCGKIIFVKTTGQSSELLSNSVDYLLWFAKDKEKVKFRRLYDDRPPIDKIDERYVCVEIRLDEIVDLSMKQKSGQEPIPSGRLLKLENPTSQTGSEQSRSVFNFQGRSFTPGGSRGWSTSPEGLERVKKAGYWRIQGNSIWWKSYRDVFPFKPKTAFWNDTRPNAFSDPKTYVVQTNKVVVQHCVLSTTDPGDIVLDPTCGSGTSATVAEQWGRRWITIDTSRVALALARTRLMSAKYPYYLLRDSQLGENKEQELSGNIRSVSSANFENDIRQGFVYQRGAALTLKGIATNTAIDFIWERWQPKLEVSRAELNKLVGRTHEEWQIPREAVTAWPEVAKVAHAEWWKARIARQKEIDASIAKAADVELLYDRPYEDKSRVRVAGPFTVESLSPHRVLHGDDEELIDMLDAGEGKRGRATAAAPPTDFAEMVLEHLRSAGVHQSEKRDTIRFNSLQPWPGVYIGAKGTFLEGETERQAGIFIGPEFGTMNRVDLVAAAREATDARADVLIACAFAFDAHASELTKLGPLPILKAKMNPDLHMSEDLKNTGKGNLFIVFGEPDFEVRTEPDGRLVVKINGVDVFDPNTGEIRSGDTNSIAAWFIDTDYDEESLFVRHAYFLGAGDPYKSLKTALQAEIDEDAWATLYRAESRPFARPATGKIAIKVINHFGDEVMKVFRV